MKLIPELSEQLRELEDWKSAGIGKQIGTIRVDARQMEQLRHEVNCEGFTLTIDESEFPYKKFPQLVIKTSC